MSLQNKQEKNTSVLVTGLIIAALAATLALAVVATAIAGSEHQAEAAKKEAGKKEKRDGSETNKCRLHTNPDGTAVVICSYYPV